MSSLPKLNHPCTSATALEQTHHCCPEHQCTAPYVIGAGATGGPGALPSLDNGENCTGAPGFLTACGDCRFWQANAYKKDGDGWCRRHAPTAVHFAQIETEDETRGDSGAVWPTTGCDEWCGEFQPRVQS